MFVHSVATSTSRLYAFFVVAKSATDFSRSNTQRRIGANQIAGAFFVPVCCIYGSCARDTSGCAGFLCVRSANPRTATTIRLAADRGSSEHHKGATSMKLPSPLAFALRKRVSAHKSMALAALNADSSLNVRLSRYNHHMNKARELEKHGGEL